MKMEEILKLIEAVSASELTDFKYEENGTKLNLKKEQQKVEIIQSPGVVPVTGTVTAGLQTAEILQNPGNEADHTQEEHQEVIKETEGELIVSPLVGTFYAALLLSLGNVHERNPHDKKHLCIQLHILPEHNLQSYQSKEMDVCAE